MSLVITNWINAVAAPALSGVVEVTGSKDFSFQVSSTGNPPTVRVHLEGSVDGSNWAVLVTANLNATITAALVFATDKPVRYIRANFDNLSGGTSPTVSASVLAI